MNLQYTNLTKILYHLSQNVPFTILRKKVEYTTKSTIIIIAYIVASL